MDIVPVVEPPGRDIPFYQWDSQEALMRAVQEADRHLCVGSLEYVPVYDMRRVAKEARRLSASI